MTLSRQTLTLLQRASLMLVVALFAFAQIGTAFACDETRYIAESCQDFIDHHAPAAKADNDKTSANDSGNDTGCHLHCAHVSSALPAMPGFAAIALPQSGIIAFMADKVLSSFIPMQERPPKSDVIFTV